MTTAHTHLQNCLREIEAAMALLPDAPKWQLPSPPAGHEWHRADFTQDMLPDGWRPLLLGECTEPEDEFFVAGTWMSCGQKGAARVGYCNHNRTRRPLPQPSVPRVAELREYCAEVCQIIRNSAVVTRWASDSPKLYDIVAKIEAIIKTP